MRSSQRLPSVRQYPTRVVDPGAPIPFTRSRLSPLPAYLPRAHRSPEQRRKSNREQGRSHSRAPRDRGFEKGSASPVVAALIES